MIKTKMKDRNKLFTKFILKVWGIVFGILGAITVIFPINEIFLDWKNRVIVFGILIFIIIVSTIVATFYSMNIKTKIVYSKESTKISFEYDDFGKILKENHSETCTVVIPINTELQFLGAVGEIKENSVHGACLKYLEDNNVHIDKSIINEAKYKNISSEGNRDKGKIGDWFLVTPEMLGLSCKIQFLFLEINDLEKKETYFSIKSLSKEEYYTCLAYMTSAIADATGIEEKIYIPLLGAGNALVGKTKDIMFFMEGFLRFNKASILRDIHVVIPVKKKDEAPIYLLRNIH